MFQLRRASAAVLVEDLGDGAAIVLAVFSGEIDKSDLEKLVKDKEATEIKAAEAQRVI